MEYAEKQMSHNERHLLHMLSTFTNRPACVDEIALLTIRAIYHDPKRAEWTMYEYIAYHILITWYASSSKTQVEKLCKLREIYYAMGYAKNFDMYLADSKFELPRMKKGGKANKHHQLVYLCWKDKIRFPQVPKFLRDPMGRIQKKEF